MNQAQRLQQAIAILWPVLPDLVGQDWQKFAQTVRSLLSKFEETTEPAEIESICDRLFQLFFEYEEADTRLHRLLAVESFEELPLKGVLLNAGVQETLESLSIDVAEQPPTLVTRYTDIACPSHVWVETPRVSVVVRLTEKPSTYSAATEEVELQTELPIQVRLDAPAFTILNDALQETNIPAEGDTAPLVFDLAPQIVGHTTLTFDFLQGGNPLRTVTVPIEVTAVSVAADAPDRAGSALRLQADGLAPDLILHIGWQAARNELEFTLIRDGGAWWRTFPPVKLVGDPAAHAAALYQKITTLVDTDDPTLQTVLGQQRQIPLTDVDRRIKQLGQNLWADLIPGELQQLYLAERERWQGNTLLLWSDEPHIPWELVWPYDNAGEDEGPWCTTLRLTRWLRRNGRGDGNEGAPPTVALRSLSVLAPTYTILPNLAAAQQEKQFFATLIHQHHLDNCSPSEPTWSSVMDLLEGGQYHWLHVAAHGNFYPQSPDGDSALWLAGDQSLTPDAIVGSAIERHIHNVHPGFFFNACEVGRQGWALTRLGGWANRLVSAGAGLFVGPHWAVRDNSALTFAETFYTQLFQGETLGEATYQARIAARQEGDPTWLAYSVYGHPNAKIHLA